jgi:hypothetical protein
LTGNGTSLQIGYGTGRGKITIVSANDSCGLTLFGNNQDHTCIQIYNGDFIMDGGKITGFGISSSTGIGAVNLPDNTDLSKRRVFTMRKGEISGNEAVVPGVYAAPGTSFIMEGGKIINNTINQAGFAVGVYGTMYISGLIQIGGTTSTDNKHSDGSKANVLLTAGNKFIINAPLATGTHIGVSASFGANIPTTTNQVALTQNYTNNESPAEFFSYDEYSTSRPYVFVRATQTGIIGEAALTKGGGTLYSARDFNFSLSVTFGQAQTNPPKKQVIITPAVTYGGVTVYYNETDRKVYWDAELNNKVSDDLVDFGAELSIGGDELPSYPTVYQPIRSTPRNKFIFSIDLPGTYTLNVTASYMGIDYSASFDFNSASLP